jgi:hypothetical protein
VGRRGGDAEDDAVRVLEAVDDLAVGVELEHEPVRVAPDLLHRRLRELAELPLHPGPGVEGVENFVPRRRDRQPVGAVVGRDPFEVGVRGGGLDRVDGADDVVLVAAGVEPAGRVEGDVLRALPTDDRVRAGQLPAGSERARRLGPGPAGATRRGRCGSRRA